MADLDLLKEISQDLDLDLNRSSPYSKEGPKEAGVDFLQSSYRHMLHAKGTEAVIKATATRGKKEIQQYTTGSAYIDFDGIRVNIEEYAKLNLKLTPLTGKLLQLMLIGATQLLKRDAVTEIRLDLNLSKVAEALAATKDFQAVTGKTSLDASHDAVKSAVIVGFKDGKQVYRATVNP